MKTHNFTNTGMKISKLSVFTVAAILFLTIITTSTCKAQAALLVLIFGDKIATEKFHTSIDAGLNFSRMPGLDNTKMRYGLYFGLGTFLKLNDKWAFTPEFKPLSLRGAHKITPLFVYNDISDPQYDLRLNYIDIPFMVQYKIKPNFFVSVGPQISFLTKAEQETSGKTSLANQQVTVSEDFKSSFNPLYLSFPVEVGYSFPELIPGHGMDIKIRYCIGINDVIKDQAYGSSRLSSWQVFACFPFIKKEGEKK
jgi:hypothetical protein